MDIHDFNPSRRRFLSGMLAVGAASALAPNPLISKVWAAGENPEQWIQSGSHYGAFEAKVVNGEWTETRPFKHDKYPCDMLNAVREVVYNPSRVRYPMVRLDWLRKRPYTVLFLDGSHENYDLLAQYPETELFGGRVQSLGGNVYHVCRGSVLELEGKTYLCFGGAESQDKDDREPGVNWWKQEMPSDEEYDTCRRNLETVDYKVDYVLTHDAPSRFLDFTALALGESNRLHLFLDEILLKLTYEKWFFGCYHKDVQLSTKSRCVFCDVIPMGERRTGLFHR